MPNKHLIFASILCALPLASALGVGCSDGETANPATSSSGSGSGSGGDQSSSATGTGGAGGGAGGGAAQDELKGPIVRGDKYVLEFGDIYFEVTPAVGGRITSARVGATELLTGADVNDLNYGSTFWPSPQEAWGWPPLTPIDSEGYAPTAEASSFTLVGAKVSDAKLPDVNGLSVTKKFSPDFKDGAVIVEYILKNEGDAPKTLAPWEITRVAAGGLTFFPADGKPTGTNLPPLVESGGVTWFKYEAATVTKDSKLFADGKGWIAHVTPENLLLVKTFPDIKLTEAAPKEAEIEIYENDPAVPAKAYVEVENQGAYSEIPAGAELGWTVRWYLRALPSEVKAEPGNAELLKIVTDLVQ